MSARAPKIRTDLSACPVCEVHQDAGQIECLPREAQLTAQIQTRPLGPIAEAADLPSPQGSAVREADAPIVFKIAGTNLALPLCNTITVGRPCSQSSRWKPHVDLSTFGAHEHGVSRRHIRFTSRDRLTYVSDLNSTNGTWLNGQRLTPFTEYLLHDGDELRLGLLKIKIHF